MTRLCLFSCEYPVFVSACNFIKKRESGTGVSLGIFSEFLEPAILDNTSGRLLPHMPVDHSDMFVVLTLGANALNPFKIWRQKVQFS